jgi:hypothetical protein
MADRYWIGGGSQLWRDENEWSDTSGGPGGASVPRSGDSVFFDENSGAAPIEIDTNTDLVDSIDFTGYSGIVMLNATLATRAITLNTDMSFDNNAGTPILRMSGVSGDTNCSYTANDATFPYKLLIGTFSTVLTLNGEARVQDLEINVTVTNGIARVNDNNLIVLGDFTITSTSAVNATAGSGAIILAGTGTWSSAGFENYWSTSVIIDSEQTTISGNITLRLCTLTYVNGEVDAEQAVLSAFGITIDTGTAIVWPEISCPGFSASVTLVSDLYCRRFTSLPPTANPYTISRATTAPEGTGIYILDAINITANRPIRLNNVATQAPLYLVGADMTVNMGSSSRFVLPIVFSSNGKITMLSDFYFASAFVNVTTATLRYEKGFVDFRNHVLRITNGCTLLNMNSPNFAPRRVEVANTSSNPVSMNEFFSGKPGKPTVVSISNFGFIRMLDGFEKIAKNVIIDRITFVGPHSILVLSPNSGTNRNFRKNNTGYIRQCNQHPNGISTASRNLRVPLAFPNGDFLIADPTVVSTM